MRLVLGLLIVSWHALAGGPPSLTPEQERERDAQDRRQSRFERAWKAQGSKAIPTLVTIACGDDPVALDLMTNAARALAERGAEGVRALLQYKGACRVREVLLADLYCGAAGPYRDPLGPQKEALARWAQVIADDTHPQHVLAVKTLGAVLARRGLAACDVKLYEPMLPKLMEVLRRLPHRGHDDLAGTFRLSAAPRDELVIHAVAQSADPEGVALLRSVYDGAELRTKVVVIEALARSRAAGAAAIPQVLHFISLTSDDQARVLGLRALAGFEAPLDEAGQAQLAPVVSELVARLKPRTASLPLDQDGWAIAGSTDGLRVLLRSTIARGSPAQQVLFRALAASLSSLLRTQVAQKLLSDEAALSAAQRKCAQDTLVPPPPSAPLRELPANSEPASLTVSFSPPSSCAK
ncbi:MAG: hypothetical protein Q8L48_42940 [Archangium sp.]|nr:hypothetical protein [Archangium sp.]